jgi:hypothetical protein
VKRVSIPRNFRYPFICSCRVPSGIGWQIHALGNIAEGRRQTARSFLEMREINIIVGMK